jgi:glucose-1-phosphate thymidylyltransferase
VEIARALILAGSGTDDPAWATTSATRHLFPIGNRPLLSHSLQALRAAGVLEVAILSNAGTADAIRSHVGDGRAWDLGVVHADWEPGAGLQAALSDMRGFLADEPVLVGHGDALIRGQLPISSFARDRLDALALRPHSNAATQDDALGYLFSPDAIAMLQDGVRDDACPMAGVEARGGRVGVAHVEGCLPWGGDADALIERNRCVLEGLQPDVDPATLKDSTIHGAVQIHPTARVTRSLLRGPVVVGPGTEITDAYVGPYTAIGAGVVIEGAEIEHSIVLSGAQVRFVGTRLESSIIGRGARVVRGFELPAAIRLTIGDGAEVVVR